MYSRAIRYRIEIRMSDGWTDGAAFSRRKDALKRASVIRDTWRNWESIVVRDSRTGESLWKITPG